MIECCYITFIASLCVIMHKLGKYRYGMLLLLLLLLLVVVVFISSECYLRKAFIVSNYLCFLQGRPGVNGYKGEKGEPSTGAGFSYPVSVTRAYNNVLCLFTIQWKCTVFYMRFN